MQHHRENLLQLYTKVLQAVFSVVEYIGLGRWDIKFVFPGDSISRTEIFRVNVIDSVTV